MKTKNMNFLQACEYLPEGAKVYRAAWVVNDSLGGYVFIDEEENHLKYCNTKNRGAIFITEYTPKIYDIMANDWCVLLPIVIS